jgi:hypothetical protein
MLPASREDNAMDGNVSRLDLISYEAKATSIRQERQQEELRLERLKIRLRGRMQQPDERPAETAA